ncbi:hypothetical protein [Hydrogenimonas sp.]
MKRNQEEVLPPAYEGVERHLTALFYSGVYITNSDIVQIGRSLGLDLPMKDRTALLKQIMRFAHEEGRKRELMQGFHTLIKERSDHYAKLLEEFPEAAPLIEEWLRKARATALLLQREMRSSPYE